MSDKPNIGGGSGHIIGEPHPHKVDIYHARIGGDQDKEPAGDKRLDEPTRIGLNQPPKEGEPLEREDQEKVTPKRSM